MTTSTSTPAAAASLPEKGPSGTEVLLEAVRRQRGRVLSTAAALRLGAAALLLLISLVLWQVSGDDDWSTQVPTLIAYGTLALVTFMTQGRAVMIRVAWVQPLLDVGFAYAALRTSILLGAAGEQPMAGLSVAILLLPVALAGLAYGTRTLVVVTLAAALSNFSLMAQTELTLWPMIAATAVLLLAASGSKLARETVEAEIARRLLAESHARCEELANLQREKNSLLGIIVHDMGTPVSTTLLSLEYLQSQMKRQVVPRAWLEATTEALASSSNLSDMIAQILDTTRLEAGRTTLELTVVDACQLLDRARDRALTHALSKSITLEMEAPGTLPVTVDRRLILRTFESLIACAIRQTPTGGRILLEARRDGTEACIAVHRSGASIPAERREAVFAKFQPGDSSAARLAGWGLGLYFSRLTAEAHGAKLSLESADGWASSYVLRLSLPPAAPPQPEPQEPVRRHATPLTLPSAMAGDLLSPRRTPSSPQTQAALAELVRAFASLDGQPSRRRTVC